MQIGKHDIDQKVLIVAEIGVNHEGNVDVARMLVEKAAETGVDAVKFQTYQTALFVTSEDRDRFAAVERRSLTYDVHYSLAELAESLGLTFLSTPLDLESVDFLDAIVPAFKIASGDLTFLPLLAHVAKKGKPVILSTGMSIPEEIDQALQMLRGHGLTENLSSWLVLMHCVSCYPTPIEQANLLGIDYLRDRYSLTIGYSDHTLGTTACLAAVARGARVIEKHFTYRKENQQFRDHQLSADPRDMAMLVKQIREVEAAFGTRGKPIAPCEEALRVLARRSLGVRRSLASGEILRTGDLVWLRPATGVPIGKEGNVVGRRVKRSKAAGQILFEEDLE